MSRSRKVVIKVPHRISGFFEIVDEYQGVKLTDPVSIGSRGAGFNLSALGITKIEYEKIRAPSDSEFQIYINGELLNQKAETTWYILRYIAKKFGKPLKIKIEHEFELPVGCGFGASGSGALGTVYGLNYLLKLGMSSTEMGRIAHISEVENRTGLGTICGQLSGGLSILKQPGYPCRSEKIEIPRELIVICGTFGMIHTKSILSDPQLNAKIKLAGKEALKTLIRNPDINTFIKASIDFVQKTEILDILNLSKTKQLMDALNRLDILGASMNQLGRSVFAICKKNDEEKVSEVFNSFKPDVMVFSLNIYNDKIIVLED